MALGTRYKTLKDIAAVLSSFEAFLDIMRVFGSVQPRNESTSPFLNIIIFQKMTIFGAPAPLLG